MINMKKIILISFTVLLALFIFKVFIVSSQPQGVKIAGNGLFANFVSKDFGDSFYTIEKRKFDTVDLNNYKPLGRSDNWRVTISGYIYFPQDSLYNISIWCDDGCILLIARPGEVTPLTFVGASTGWKDQPATRYPNVNFPIPFDKGYGKILIQHYQAGGLEKLQLRWNSSSAGIPDQVIPASNLFYTDETQSTI